MVRHDNPLFQVVWVLTPEIPDFFLGVFAVLLYQLFFFWNFFIDTKAHL